MSLPVVPSLRQRRREHTVARADTQAAPSSPEATYPTQPNQTRIRTRTRDPRRWRQGWWRATESKERDRARKGGSRRRGSRFSGERVRRLAMRFTSARQDRRPNSRRLWMRFILAPLGCSLALLPLLSRACGGRGPRPLPSPGAARGQETQQRPTSDVARSFHFMFHFMPLPFGVFLVDLVVRIAGR